MSMTDPTLEPVSVRAGSTDRHEHILPKDQSKSDLGKKNIHESAVSEYGEGSTGSAQAGNGQEAGGSVAPQQNRPAGVGFVVGVDEVGRGAWAGPLLFVAVALKKTITGLTDSKKLTRRQRVELAEQTKESASYIGYGWVSASEVDDLGLTEASKLACRRALKKSPKTAQIMIDGNINYCPDRQNVVCVVNGDDKVPEISAASIVAKVARDDYMTEQAKLYPAYGFESNVGYGTAKHRQAIKDNGLTPIHRWSYKPIKEFTDNYEI